MSMNHHLTSVRIGFIGAGGIVDRHVGVLAQMPDVEIAAFADPDFERAIRLAHRCGARAYRTHDDMLAFEKLDALYICVPPFAHGEPERAAIAAGLPFFVEKPLSLDLATAADIAVSVAGSGLVTAVGYHWRYLDTVEEAKAILVGNPAHLISGHWLDQTPPPHWWWRNDQSGGQIVEQATHLIDLARYVAGDVTDVYALAAHAPARGDFPGLDVATATAVTLGFASGAVGNLSSTCLLRWSHAIGLHIFADGLAIELSDHDIMVDIGQGRPVRQAGEDPVFREDRDFIDAISDRGNRIRCSYGEALKTHRVALAITQSAKTGNPIRMEDWQLETIIV